ncbi:MAG: GNAT family N-acetyltransferase [Halobacteriovoraceae bacterium]|nr:GNAT family N-acetyltransferase [Halobacteriovoraceae bacterium]
MKDKKLDQIIKEKTDNSLEIALEENISLADIASNVLSSDRFRKFEKVRVILPNEIIQGKKIGTYDDVPYTQVTDARDFVINSLLDSYEGGRMPFMSSTEKEETRAILTGDKIPWNTVIFGKDHNSPLGLMVLGEVNMQDGPRKLIAWIWAAREINKSLKGQFRNSVLSMLQKNINNDIVAAIHLRNIKSLKFFHKLGFRPISIVKNK